MRLTIISILEDLAVKLPPVRRNIELVRLQFAARFKHEDLMMQQITPPGFDAAEKVHLLTSNSRFSERRHAVWKTLEMPWYSSDKHTSFEMLVLPVASVSSTGTAQWNEREPGHMDCTLRLIFV